MWRFSSDQGVVRASVVNADFGQLGVDLYLEPDTPVFVSLILTGERGEQASFVRRSAAEMKHHAGEIMAEQLKTEQQAAWTAARLGELGGIIDDLRQRARRLSEAQEERK